MVNRSRNEKGEVLRHLGGLTRNRTGAGLLSWMLLLTLMAGFASSVVAADLVMTASDSPDPVTVGDNLTYSTTVTNNGIVAITALVTNTLPVNVTFVSANSTQGSCTQSGGTVICDLGSLASGSGALVTIVVTPTTVGTITNNVSLGGNEVDPTNTVSVATAVLTVPSLSISDVSITEGNTGTRNATFTISLSFVSSQTVTANYQTADGTAISGSDYQAKSGIVSLPAGTTNQTITVTINSDTLNEPSETFFVNLSNPANATVADGQGMGTINNDDPVPTLVIDDVILIEGNSGTINAVFTVSLSSASGQTVTVNYASANGTATSGADYIATNGTLTLLPGTTSDTVIVPVIGDTANEPNETYFVNLTSPVNATLVQSQGTGTINNDDPVPTLSINDVAMVEGNGGVTTALFTVSLSAASGSTVTVNYSTVDGTAVSGSDYVAVSGTLVFPPGTTTQTIAVDVLGDTRNEVNEIFFVNLSSPVNAALADSQGIGTINNDDPVPSMSIDDLAFTEGDSGTLTVNFTVSLSAASGSTVTVNYTTVGGTATSNTDFVPASGTLQFSPGTVSQTIPITINSEVVNEADETFFVNLSGPVNATLADSQGLGTIVNDDPVPSLMISDATVTEGNAGTANAVFTVSLSAASGQTVTVNYATANGTASAGTDYVATNGVLSFAPGETVQTLSVRVNGDTANEVDETFVVNLATPTNATLARIQAIGTILNNDPLPSLAIADVTVAEGNSGTTNAVFAVSLSASSGQTVTVNYATANGTASAETDYATTSGLLTFPPGVTTQTVLVAVSGETLTESNETFFVNLSNPVNATLADSQGIGTIANDDSLPSLTITDVAVTEGNSGNVNAVFTVGLSVASAQPVTVNYTTANGMASAGTDYAATNGTLNFSPGMISQTVTVSVTGDVLNESNETFFVNLSNPVNGTLAKSQGVGTINNDDPTPSLTIADVAVFEGNSGTTNALFTLTLSAVSGQTILVNYATADGTAVASVDYNATNGVAAIIPGSLTQTVAVAIRGDTTIEPIRAFFVNLSNPVNASLADAQAVGTIVDAETRTTSFTNAATITIPSSGAATPYPSTIDFSGLPGTISQVTVTLSGVSHTFVDDLDILLVGPTGQAVMLMSDAGGMNPVNNLNLTLDDSAATTLPDATQLASASYKPANYFPGEIMPAPAPPSPYSAALSTFAGTNPNGTWALYVFDDTTGDSGSIANGWRLNITTTNLVCCTSGADADVSVTMSDSSDPALTGNNLIYTLRVVNSGPAPATGIVVTDPLPSGVTFVSANSSQGTTTFGGGAVNSSLGNLAVGASATVSIVVTPTVVAPLNNTASVSANQTDLFLANNTASVATTVNLSPPALSINDASVVEGNVTRTNVVFTVTLSRTSDLTVQVNYDTVGGTAASGFDFEATSGTLTFPPGNTLQTLTVVINGDTSIEPNETFSVALSSPVDATIADGTGTGTIVNDDALPGTIDHFVWAPIPNSQSASAPFPVTITAVDPGGSTVSSFTATVALDGLVGTGSSPSILITEVDIGDLDAVEFANVSAFPIDLSGWEVSLYDFASWPYPELTFVYPNGTVAQPGALFQLREGGTSPGVYPLNFNGVNLFWLNESTNNQVAVLLRNATGQIIDFVCAVDGFRNEIVDPVAVPFSQWSSNPLLDIANPAQTYQRIGNADHNNASDWVIANSSMGAVNSGLTIPFPGPQPVAISPAVSGNFVSGVWNGSVAVLQGATNMYLRADGRNGHIGLSGTFTIMAGADLTVSLTGLPAIAQVGQNLTYTIIATNRGPITGNNVAVFDPLPNQVSFVSANTTQGTATLSNNVVIGTVGTLNVGATATITIVVTALTPGSITNIATISGSGGDSNPANNSATVINTVNYPPTISAIANQVVNEDASTASISFTVGDAETNPGLLTLSAASSNTNLVPNTNFVFGGSGPNRTVMITPLPNRFGVTTNTITVSDGGATASTTFVLTVNSVNDPPVLAAFANLTVNEGSTLTVFSVATDADLPADVLTFSLDPGAPAGVSINPGTGVLTWTPTEAQAPSTNTITVRVTDSGSPPLSDAKSLTVIVNEVNSAPILSIANQTINEGSPFNLTITATDSDLPANTLTFNLLMGPSGATVTANGLFSWTPGEAQGPSTNTVTVRVTDNGSPPLSDTKSFTVVVTEVNNAPVLAAIANQTINEGTTLSFSVAATDADVPANALTYSLDLGAPAGASINASNGLFTWTPSEGQGPSTNIVPVRATDNGSPSLSNAKSFTVVVNEVNAPPVLAAMANQTISEGHTLTLTVSASDSDLPANGLSFTLLSPPAGASINASSGVFTWTPTETQGPGSYTITARVTDNGSPNLSAAQSFTVTVNEVNNPPVLTAIANQTINEAAALSFTVSAADADVPANTLTYSLDPGAPAAASIHPSTGVFSWTPSEAQGPGTSTIMVRVTDDGVPSLSDVKSFTVTVNEVNSAPVLVAIPNQTINEGTPLTLTLSATDPDMPVNTLTFSLLSPPAGASINASSGVFTWTPTETQGPGSYTITVRVTDNGSPSLSTTQSFTVTVNEVNNPPVLAAIADQTVPEGSPLTLTLTATDADVSANALAFSLISAPSGASLNASSGAFSWTPSEVQGPSTNTVTVRVTDNGSPNLSDTKGFTVVVTEANSPPVLTVIPNQTVNEGSPVTLTVSATDPDVPNNTLTFSLVSAPAGASLDAVSGVFSWMPTEAQGPGTNTITVRVTDNGVPNRSDTRSFSVVVNEVNTAPTLPVIADRTVNEGTTLSFTVTATDADLPANSLTYSLDPGAPAGASINAGTGAFSWTPSEAQGPGAYLIMVRVSDNGSPSLSDTSSFSVVVNETNAAPVLAVIANQTINEGSTLTLTVIATDQDVPANVLTFSLVSPPAGMSINPSSGVLTWTPSEVQGPGSYTLTVSVTDNGIPSRSDTKNFTVTVNEVNSTPVLDPIFEKTIKELNTLTFTITADDVDVPANTLTFSLLSAPTGASLDPNTGIFTWTPAATQGPDTYLLTVRVTDNGTPSLSATQNFTVVVNELNSAPIISAIADQTVDEGSPLNTIITASDPDVPANALTFSLLVPPSGATIDASTGVLTWTPTEANGPSTNTLTVRVTDDGSPPLSDTRTFTVIVNELNTTPTMAAIANQTITEGGTLTFTNSATDADVPANTLTYSLDAGAPAGASIDPTSGVFTWTPNEAQGPSTNTITIRVTDNGAPGLSNAKIFTMIVNETNAAPVLAALPNETINEGSTLSVTATAFDADVPENALTFSLLAPPSGATIDASTGVLTWTPSEAQGPGTYTLRVRVTDDGTPATSDTKTFLVTVNELNSPPLLSTLSNRSVNEGSPLSFMVTATDPDLPANALTFSLEPSAPAGASINASSGLFSWTPSETQGPGSYVINVHVADNGVPTASDTKSFTVTVTEVNNPPVLATIANQTINEGNTLTVTATATDSDVPANTVTYSLDPGAPVGATIHPTTGVFIWTPTEAQGSSSPVITVRATDNGTPPLSDAKSFTVTVNVINTAPVLAAIENRTIDEGSMLIITNTATDTDLPSNTLTFGLDSEVPAGASINSSTGLLSWMPSETQGGATYTLTVRVTDDGVPSLADLKSFNITVNEMNSAPVLAPILEQTVNEGDTLMLTVTATDPDLPANALTFSLVSGPSGAGLNPSTGLFTWRPTETQGPGSYTVRIRVTDNGSPSLSDTKTFIVSVNESNGAPALAPIADQNISQGTTLTLTATATDPDVPANNLSFALRRAPLGASINPATGVLTWTPSPDQVPSTNLITIRVTDDGTPNLSDTKSFTVVVNEVNSAPVIGAIPNQTVNEGNSLTLTITATDANGATDTLTYNLVNPPAGAAINPATGVFTWTPSEAQGPSTNTITVQVTDNGAPPLSGTENFTVVVNEVNAMPVLAAVPNQTIDEGMTLIITNVATDVDIPANTLAFSLINPPVGASVDPNTGVFTWTLSEAQGPGSYTVRVRVTDNGSPNLSDTKSFTVTVNEVNSPPVLATIANQAVNEGSALSVAVTATDPDLPANTLTFSLGPSAPVGASIDPSTGLFTWTPTAGQAPSTNLITVKVTDNGSLSDQKNFTVVVTPPTEGLALRIRTSGNYLIISANAPLDGYDLEVKDNLSSTADWLTLPNVPVGNTFIVANDPSTKTQFYRVKQRSSSSPTLRIAISANNLVISVSGSLDGFDLQVKDSLTSSPAWTTLPNAPVGNQFIIPIDFAKKTQFYRVQQRSP